MEFFREQGEGGPAQRWIDHNLPTCPLCRSESLWESASQVDQLALKRWVFRCPDCGSVLSMIPATAVSALAEPVIVGKVPLDVNIRIDSVERKEDQDFVGQEFPLTDLQEWASEEES